MITEIPNNFRVLMVLLTKCGSQRANAGKVFRASWPRLEARSRPLSRTYLDCTLLLQHSASQLFGNKNKFNKAVSSTIVKPLKTKVIYGTQILVSNELICHVQFSSHRARFCLGRLTKSFQRSSTELVLRSQHKGITF